MNWLIKMSWLALLFNIIVWWIIASAVVSGIKRISGDCDAARYPIEKVIHGDWFCPGK